MPIQPNFLERTAFYTLNAAPGPMLDLAGALAYQTLSTAVNLNIFTTLQERPSTPTELSQTLSSHERGTQHLLEALATIGYVVETKRPLPQHPHDPEMVPRRHGDGYDSRHDLL